MTTPEPNLPERSLKEKSATKVMKGDNIQKCTGALPRTLTGPPCSLSKTRTPIRTDVKSESLTKSRVSSGIKPAVQNRRPGVQKNSDNKKSGAISKRKNTSPTKPRQASSTSVKKTTNTNRSRSRTQNANAKETKKSAKQSKKSTSRRDESKHVSVVTRESSHEQNEDMSSPIPIDTFAACQAAFLHSVDTQSPTDDAMYLPLQEICPFGRVVGSSLWTSDQKEVFYQMDITANTEVAARRTDTPKKENWGRPTEPTTAAVTGGRAATPSCLMSGDDECTGQEEGFGFSTAGSSGKSLCPDTSRKRRNGPKHGSASSISDLSDTSPVSSAHTRPCMWGSKYADESGNDEPDI